MKFFSICPSRYNTVDNSEGQIFLGEKDVVKNLHLFVVFVEEEVNRNAN